MIKKVLILIIILYSSICFGLSPAKLIDSVAVGGSIKADGTRNATGKICFYEASAKTTTKNVYMDAQKTRIYNQPIILDSSGCAKIYGQGYYFVKILDKNNTLIKTLDYANFDNISNTDELYIDVSAYGNFSATGVDLSDLINTYTSSTNNYTFLFKEQANGYPIAQNLNFPSNIALKFLAGAYLDVSSPFVVNVSGNIEANAGYIFKGLGTVNLVTATNPIILGAWKNNTTTNITNLSINQATISTINSSLILSTVATINSLSFLEIKNTNITLNNLIVLNDVSIGGSLLFASQNISNSSTWNIPATKNVIFITATAAGGGGGGGNDTNGNSAGSAGGGSSGQNIPLYRVSGVASGSVVVVIGAVGTGGAKNTTGNNAAVTTIKVLDVSGNVKSFIKLLGGLGGGNNPSNSVGGLSVYNGSQAGDDGISTGSSGQGGSSAFGYGGLPGVYNVAPYTGSNGTGYGSGGGGGARVFGGSGEAGGNGGPAIVTILY